MASKLTQALLLLILLYNSSSFAEEPSYEDTIQVDVVNRSWEALCKDGYAISGIKCARRNCLHRILTCVLLPENIKTKPTNWISLATYERNTDKLLLGLSVSGNVHKAIFGTPRNSNYRFHCETKKASHDVCPQESFYSFLSCTTNECAEQKFQCCSIVSIEDNR